MARETLTDVKAERDELREELRVAKDRLIRYQELIETLRALIVRASGG